MALLKTAIALTGKSISMKHAIGSYWTPDEADDEQEATELAAEKFSEDLKIQDLTLNLSQIEAFERTDEDGELIGWEINYM